MSFSKTKGQTIVELLVAMGVAAIMLPAIVTGFVSSRQGKVQQSERARATAYLNEAVEAARVVRESGWDSIETNGVFHPEIAGGTWTLVPGEEELDGLTRSLTVSDAYRDENMVIVDSGGEVDPSTKKIEAVVSWNFILPSQVSSVFYLTRYLDNDAYVETSVNDFSQGTHNGTVVTNLDDGEVQLAAGGRANWCEPALTIAPLDLPKQGEAVAISAIEGRAFAGTGRNASGVSFANVNITNDYPPQTSILGTFDGYKTNDIFGEENYAYLATDTPAKEIVILDLTTNPYSEIGSYNSPGPTDSESVYVVGNVGYMVAGTTLYSFDLSSKSGSRPALDTDGVGLAGVGGNIYVVGTNVYVAVGSTSTQMQIIDASDPAHLTVMGYAQVAGGAGVDVFVNETQTRAYLATADSGGSELFVVDIADKSGARPTISSYDTHGMNPSGLTVVPGNVVIMVGINGEEYQVVDVSEESSIARCGGLDIDNGVNGISSVIEADGDAYSYIVTGDADSELKIIEGGPGGQLGGTGSYESAAFNPASSAAFNRFEATTTLPANTNITFQVGIADSIGGDCGGVAFSHVGPDGTADTFYPAVGGAIAFDNDGVGYENPGRCFSYKAYLEADDPTSSPILRDVTVNYSP